MFNEIMDMGLCMHVCIFVKYSNKLVLNLNLYMLDPFAGDRVIWPFWLFTCNSFFIKIPMYSPILKYG